MWIPGDEGAGHSKYDYGRPLKDGDYDARILTAEETTSSNDNPMIELQVGVDGPSEGVLVTDYRALTPKAMRFYYEMLAAVAPEVLKAIKAAGQTRPQPGEEQQGVEFDHRELAGRWNFRVRIKNEEYDGETRPKIRGYIPLPGGPKMAEPKPEEAAPEEAGAEEGGPEAPPAESAPVEAPVEGALADDDTPF